MQPYAQEVEQTLGEHRPAATEALGQRVRAQQQHRAHDFSRVRLADAHGVADEQVALECLGVGSGDAARGEVTKAGGHAVDDLVCGDELLNDGAAGRHARAGRVA